MPTSARPMRTAVWVVNLPFGMSRRSHSRARRRKSSNSGGVFPPPAGPRLHGPRGPCPFPSPGWLLQGMINSAMWGDEFRCGFRLVSGSGAVICATLPRRNEARPRPRSGFPPHRGTKDNPMAAASREMVLQALSRVVDPATGKNLVESDLVQGLVLRDGHVGFSVEVA